MRRGNELRHVKRQDILGGAAYSRLGRQVGTAANRIFEEETGALLLSASTCCVPHLSRDEALACFQRAGYAHLENFTTWTGSRFDPETEDPSVVRKQLERYGLTLSSLNVTNLRAGSERERRAQVDSAKRGIEFAASLGARIVNLKGGGRSQEDMEALIEGVSELAGFIDGMDVDGEPVLLCLGNHHGNRLQDRSDLETVLQSIDHPQVRVLVDIGHFHSSGVDSSGIIERFSKRIGLVHTKDQIGKQSVPFGSGEIDNARLMAQLTELGYGGFLVVEIEVEDVENIERYLREGREYLQKLI